MLTGRRTIFSLQAKNNRLRWPGRWLTASRIDPLNNAMGDSRPNLGIAYPVYARHRLCSQAREKLYFLWRCRLRSLRCLCLRIFFRRFLTTLPTISPLSIKIKSSPASRGSKLGLSPVAQSPAFTPTGRAPRRQQRRRGRRRDTRSSTFSQGKKPSTWKSPPGVSRDHSTEFVPYNRSGVTLSGLETNRPIHAPHRSESSAR